jgi:hypothetical protein
MEIRRKLINEVKGHDRNMNARVAAAQKRQLLGIAEEAEPYSQINENDLETWKKLQNFLNNYVLI